VEVLFWVNCFVAGLEGQGDSWAAVVSYYCRVVLALGTSYFSFPNPVVALTVFSFVFAISNFQFITLL
jgi:hypothetical protein